MQWKIYIFILLLWYGVSRRVQFRFDYTWADFKRDFGSQFSQERITYGQVRFEDNFKLLSAFAKQNYDVMITKALIISVFPINEIPNPPKIKNDPSIVPRTKLKNIDYRKQLKVTRVLDQGLQCGSCWAFAAAALLEYFYALLSNGYLYQGSPQYFLQCTYVNQVGKDGCDGGFQGDSLNMIQKNGFYQQPRASKYQYHESDSYYLNKRQPICDLLKNGMSKTKKIPFELKYYENPTGEVSIQSLENIISQYGPVTAVIDANSLVFISVGYSGLIKCTSNTSEHAVLIVGYNPTHWIIKNSYGLDWGDNGFGYIDKQNDCKIRSQIISINAINYPKPPPIQNTTLKIIMSCLGGCKNWSGARIGLRQQNNYFFDFGSNIASPVFVVANGKIYTDIFVQQTGTNFQTVSFTISNSQSMFFQFKGGSKVPLDQILGYFCGIQPCAPIKRLYQYFLFLRSIDQQGWSKGNSIGIYVNGLLKQIIEMPLGSLDGPYLIDVDFQKRVQIKVFHVSRSSWRVIFQVKNVYKKVIREWGPICKTKSLTPSQVLASWIANNSN